MTTLIVNVVTQLKKCGRVDDTFSQYFSDGRYINANYRFIRRSLARNGSPYNGRPDENQT